MRHHKKGRAFAREDNQRKALLRSLSRTLILRQRMETSLAKAKEIRPIIEKLITKAKSDTLATRRLLQSRLGSNDSSISKLFETAKRFEKRNGGYTRIIKLPIRKSDSSERAVIEFV
ncbi:MAG: 50S ribosomal protein L17 [Patescibacteria group bacterium]|mgnify:CR=1 FL=1